MGSSSENSENSHNSKRSSITSHDDDGDFMASFRNLGLKNLQGTSLNNNFGVGSSSSYSVSSEQGSQKEEIFYGGQVNGALGKRPVNSCVSETSSESPICQDNLWAYHNSINGGGYLPSYLHSGPGNFTCMTNNTSNFLEYDLVTSPRTPLTNYSSYGSPSNSAKTLMTSYSSYGPACTPNFSNQLRGTSLWDDQACVYNCGMGYNMSNGYNLYPTSGVSVGNGYNLHKNRGKSGGSVLDCLPEGVDLVMMAKTRNGSQILHRLLGAGDKEARIRIFVEVFESIPELMIDPNGHHVFQKLIDSCKDIEFQIIVRKLTSENRFLIDAAFDIHGSYSIQKFIKRLKKSPMAFTVTSILSTSFFEMMTHATARHVIYQCLNHLGVQPNMVLFEEAINNCYTLASHHVGCVAINECIDFITGAQRDRLLQLLADQSVYLANDPSGNFVVQRVLNTRNPLVVDKVCHSLRGHYRQLSTKKGGSHVVEMCIRYSKLGMTFAVQEFLASAKALVQLAKDQFGNYVIQTTLRITKLESIELYEALAETLKPHFWFLERYKTGKSVVTLIREKLDHLETGKRGQEQENVEEREDRLKRDAEEKV